MAVIGYEVISNPLSGSGIILVKWSNMTALDTGYPVVCGHFSDKSVQVKGTFGVAGNCQIQGSNDTSSETWATLNDPQGNALDITAAKIEQVLENPYSIRPSITAGDVTTSLTVTMLMASSR